MERHNWIWEKFESCQFQCITIVDVSSWITSNICKLIEKMSSSCITIFKTLNPAFILAVPFQCAYCSEQYFGVIIYKYDGLHLEC